jgi:hypothetical protein
MIALIYGSVNPRIAAVLAALGFAAGWFLF